MSLGDLQEDLSSCGKITLPSAHYYFYFLMRLRAHYFKWALILQFRITRLVNSTPARRTILKFETPNSYLTRVKISFTGAWTIIPPIYHFEKFCPFRLSQSKNCLFFFLGLFRRKLGASSILCDQEQKPKPLLIPTALKV